MVNPVMNEDTFKKENFVEVAKIMWTASTGYDCRLIGDTPVEVADIPPNNGETPANFDFDQLKAKEQIKYDNDDAALAQALLDAGIQTPDGATIKIVRDDTNVFHVVVRERELARAALKDLLADSGTYTIHPDLEKAYRDFFLAQHNGDINTDKSKRVEIADYRLVDYTFGTCAS